MRALLQNRASGRALLGTFCALGSIDAVELACRAGFDFIILDGQHGAFDLRGLCEAIRAVDAAGGCPVVRLPAHGLSLVESVLDAGCAALLAPMVNTPERAAELVAAACYPPAGRRSRSGCRASLREGAAYYEAFNGRLTLMVMIESRTALEQVERIAAVPGVTACFVGPNDLAASLAGPGADGATACAAALDLVRAACAAAGKPAGIAARTVEEARQYARRGFGIITLQTDRRFLAAAFEQALADWRAKPSN